MATAATCGSDYNVRAMREPASIRQAMKPFGKLVSFDDALRTALSLAERPPVTDRVHVTEAVGRVTVDAVRSPVDVPSTDRAAMDGYAVIAADLASATSGAPVRLRTAGRILAGDLGEAALLPGSCIEVATGAQLPHGSDAVVPVEHTRDDGDDGVLVDVPSRVGKHVSRRGEDLQSGDPVVAAGKVVSPATSGVLASIGVSEIDVVKAPRILLIPTGDELVPLGEELLPGQSYDSNSVALRALLSATTPVVERSPVVGDDATALAAALEDPQWDLVVTLGGTSVGRHDLVLDVVRSVGEVLVHGVALKPGKPLLLARVGDTAVVGLPGFPTSCLMTGYIFVEPMVRVMAGLAPGFRSRVDAELAEEVDSPQGKRQFLTVKLANGKAVPAYRASSALTSVSAADGWIEIPEDTTRAEAGARFEVTLF